MTAGYQPLENARFTVEPGPTGELIRIRPRKQLFPLLFLPIWLTGWTIGGIVAISQVIGNFQAFLAIWLCFWAVGWVAVAGTLTWMIAGTETLRIRGGDLEIAHHALGFSRRWLFQGGQIRNLGVADLPAGPFRFRWQVPFLRPADSGVIRFDYGARTIRAAGGLDEAEGRMIVDRLIKHLSTARRI